MVLYSFSERAEYDASLLELIRVSRRDRYRVEHGINGDAGKALALVKRDAQFVERFQHLRIDFVQTLRSVVEGFRRCVVVDVLVVDIRISQLGPARLSVFTLQLAPVLERLQPPLEHPIRLIFLLRDQPNNVSIQTLGSQFHLDISRESPLVARVIELGFP